MEHLVSHHSADPKAVDIIKKHDKSKSNRTNWDRYWKELADYFIPQKGNVYGQYSVGQKVENRLYDSTSVHAVELLASALHGMLTNPSLNWFGLSTGDELLDRKKPVAEWLEDSRNKMITVLNGSNFQTEVHELYTDLVSFGTGLMGIDRDDETVVRFSCSPIYEAYVEEDNKGKISIVSAEKEWTLTQIVQEFGEKVLLKKCPELMEQYKNDPEGKEKIIHRVYPRDSASKSNVPNKMAFGSCHVIRKYQQVLRESGYKTQRNVVPRWTKLSNEVYGRSPAMKCLSDVKTLNAVVQSFLQAAQLRATPPIQAPDDGLMAPQKIRPATTLFYRAGTKDRFEPLNLGGDLAVNEKLIERITANITRAFFIDQLQLREGPQMTATESSIRSQNSLKLMSPILGRLHNELLKPIIDRTFEIMMEEELFAVIPPELNGVAKLEINYTSQIAKAQKESELDAFPKFLQSAGPIIELRPEVMDNINADEFMRHIWHTVGLPERALVDATQVKTQREQRAQQMAAAQAQQQEAHDADVSSKVAPNMLKAQEMEQAQAQENQ